MRFVCTRSQRCGVPHAEDLTDVVSAGGTRLGVGDGGDGGPEHAERNALHHAHVQSTASAVRR